MVVIIVIGDGDDGGIKSIGSEKRLSRLKTKNYFIQSIITN